MIDTESYDPATCITAGELREAGAEVPDNVPDCGWVPRASMRLTPGKATHDTKTKRLSIDVGLTFTEPFRWVDVKVECTTNPYGHHPACAGEGCPGCDELWERM